MRMIEQEIVTALRKGKDFSTPNVQDMHRKKEGSRDVITWDEDLFQVCLWGYPIATGDTSAKVLKVSDCGYPTATTRSRLNAVFAALDIPMACTVRKKKMVYFYRGKEITGKEVETSDYVISIA